MDEHGSVKIYSRHLEVKQHPFYKLPTSKESSGANGYFE